MWIVDAKLSAVRIGLQDKEFVKRGHKHRLPINGLRVTLLRQKSLC